MCKIARLLILAGSRLRGETEILLIGEPFKPKDKRDEE